MRKSIFKILSAILILALALSAVSFMATAENMEDPYKAKSDEFIAAGVNGGSITFDEYAGLSRPIVVEKNLTVNLVAKEDGSSQGQIGFFNWEGMYDSFDTAITVKPGATLTINCDEALYSIAFFEGTLMRLEANAEKAANLVVNGGQFGGSTIIKSTATAQTKKPSVVINDGYFTNGVFLDGSADVIIKQGEFGFNPQEYLNDKSYIVTSGDSEVYSVVMLSDTVSPAIKKHLNSNGEIVINRYHPSLDNDYDAFIMDLESMFYDHSNPNSYFIFSQKEEDKAKDIFLVSYYDSLNGTEEHHLLKAVFNYDKEMKKEMDRVIENMPKSDDPEDPTYWYKTTDLELVNYWLSSSAENDNPTLFVNFSGEFKKAFGYKNYSFYLDPRMGGGPAFSSAVGGQGLFMHNGVVYGSSRIGVEGDHILYVPSDTENTVAAKKAAVQAKLDQFLGEDKVEVKETTVWEAILYSFWLMDKEFILEVYPNATFEQFKNAELEGMYPAYYEPSDPEYQKAIENDSGLKGVTGTTPCFTAEINGINRYFMVECNSAKIVETPKYQGVDAVTNVSVATQGANIPFDTEIQVQKLESGAEYDRVIGVLKVGANATYDIKLYSKTAQKYVTKLESGTFEVKLPVPNALKGKTLAVYYVDSENKITKHDAPVKDGFATFITDHFSTYVLSEIRAEDIESQFTESTVVQDTDKGKSPLTGDNTNIILLLALAFVSGAATVYSVKKIKE